MQNDNVTEPSSSAQTDKVWMSRAEYDRLRYLQQQPLPPTQISGGVSSPTPRARRSLKAWEIIGFVAAAFFVLPLLTSANGIWGMNLGNMMGVGFVILLIGGVVTLVHGRDSTPDSPGNSVGSKLMKVGIVVLLVPVVGIGLLLGFLIVMSGATGSRGT